MTRFLPRHAPVVGTVLVVATVLGLVLAQGSPETTDARGALVVAVGAVKAMLVLHWFMEVRDAPSAVRGWLHGLLVVLGLGLIAILLLTP